MKTFRSVLVIGAGLFVSLNFLHAAVLLSAQSVETSGGDDFSLVIEAAEQTTPTPAADVPAIGEFHSAAHPDWPPLPGNFGYPAWNLGGSVWLLDDLTTDSTSIFATKSMTLMSDADLDPGDGGTNSDGGDYTNSFVPFVIDTNLLWLELTNYDGNLAYLNIHNATNFCYAIWGTTALPGGWNVETELFPTDGTDETNCLPFMVATLGRTNLYLRAMDWTGIDSDGDGIPDWWIWKYFGDLSETATNLDSGGINTLGYDYANGLDPNVISFTVRLGNQHFNSMLASGGYVVFAGTPSYEAVLVDDTNFNDAVWQPYDGNIIMALGQTDGVYQVTLGLKGLAPDSTPTWVGTQVYLDQAAPVLTITHPAGGTVALPYIQLQGLADRRLAGVTYDISNALGVLTGQPGSVTGEFLDTNSLTFTTTCFQCYDVWLAGGLNVITVHATDLAGNVGSTNISYTLDYSGKTNPPVITLDWPQDGMQIGQSNITVRGMLSDPTATITLQVTDIGCDTNVMAGVVERDGHFWIQNVPLTAGTNGLTLTAQDVVSNTATMNLTVTENADAGLTIDPVTDDLWESSATVSGTIADDSYAVTVNGVPATNDGYGGWTAYNVPVNSGNVALFNAQAASPGNSNSVAAQTATIKPAALKLAAATWSDEWMDTNANGYHAVTQWDWTAGQGGGWHLTEDYYSLSTWLPNTGWADAPLAADGSVPYVHMVDTEGADYYVTNPLLGPEPWRYDFPQEVGSLEAVNPSDANKWENKSGTASWVLHAGELSVAGNNASLMVLTGTATEEVPGAGTIAYGANVSGPEITNTGDQEDTNYLAALVMQDGTDKKSTMTTDRPLASVGNAPGQYKLIHQTEHTALTDTNRARLNLGVGEQVDLSGMPGDATWTASGGGLSATTGSGVTFTAPSNACSATVTATIRGQSLQVAFAVKEPSDATSVTNSIDTFPAGAQGAGMYLTVTWHPTDVSFYRVQMMEIPGPAINITGYFTNFPATNLWHQPSPNWIRLTEDNQWVDHASCSGWGQPWSPGENDWDVPVQWSIVGANITNSFPHEFQQHIIDSADGTTTEKKLGSSTTRTP